MGFTDLFRPRHRHSNAAVRAEAVRQLGPDQADLVATIARDDRDASVRRIAIDKLEDPDLLADIARSESERALRERASERAAELWISRAAAASDAGAAERALAGLARIGDQKAIAEIASRAELAAVREAALAKLADAKALAELARSSGAQLEIRMTALARIEDLEVLRSIAVDETRKEIAVAAVERIEDAAALDQVVAKAKSKAARARARKKLGEREASARAEAPTGPSPEELRKHAERVQLARQAETLAQNRDLTGAPEALAELNKAWTELGAGNDAELAMRFRRACDRVRRNLELATEAVTRKSEQQAAEKAEKAAREQAAREEARKAAEKAAAVEAEKAAAKAEKAAAKAEKAAALDEEAQARKREEEQRRAEERQREEERKRQRRERQERDLATLAELTSELEGVAADAKLKTLDRLLQKADKSFGELSLPDNTGEAVTRFQTARQAVFIKARELREAEDWQRWANVPRQEALIEKAKALAADPSEEVLVDKLKALQAEWKEVGPVPQKKSQELWNAFKAACDQAYERVKAGRMRVVEEQAQNLARKEELCVQAEALSDSTDWDRAAEELKRLQREWKQIGPAPRKQADAVWKRFRTACDKFFERRKPHLDELMAERQRNLEQKQALCEKVEALAESTDWQATGNELRNLQRDWKNIGPVPRKDADAVNKRFRAACDRFFARRQEAREAEKNARQRQIAELRTELEALLAAGAEAENAVERTLQARTTLRELEVSDSALFELADRVSRVMLEAHADGFRGTELDPQATRQKKEKLLARAEGVAPRTQATTPKAAQTAEEIAQALRAALAENALSSSLAASTEVKNIAETITELRDSWIRLGPVPGPEGDELEERFRSACQRALRAAGAE